ncbi:hypothetical protein GOODEAATRI_030291, partial [Goodea atripinnis]
ECDPPVVGTHPPVTLLMKGDHHPSHPRGTVPVRHTILKRRVNHDSPTTSRDLRYSGQISLTPEALPPRSFLITSAWVMKESNTGSPASASTSTEFLDSPQRTSTNFYRNWLFWR